MIVYILNSSSIPNVRSQKLKQLFSNDMFTVFIVNPIPPGGWNSLPLNQLTLEQVMEIYQYQWCLNDAKLKYPEENVIVVKENSVSNVSPNTLAELISNINRREFQIAYLCKWQDRCDLYTNKTTVPDSTTLIVKTESPFGIQALLFTPSGRDIVINLKPTKSLSDTLNEIISENKISAITIVPNLLDFDITTATNNIDYLKVGECRQPPMQQNGQGGSFPILWLLFSIILILIVAWCAVIANS